MNNVYLLLGSNEGERGKNLSHAAELIREMAGEIVKCSSVYETDAWGKEDTAPFLNRVLLVRTELRAREILEKVLSIEHRMGRLRAEKWEQRIIDIDILFYNEEIIDEKDLKIPHPFIQERKFTLVPMVELAPDLLHPVLKKTMIELLDDR